jgi:hypothetical protein
MISVIISAIFLALIIAFLVYGIATRENLDRGLMERDGKKLTWDTECFPLSIWFFYETPDWLVMAYKTASNEWCDKTGVRFFDYGTDAPLDLKWSKLTRSHVGIRLGTEQHKASTRHKYDPKTGEIGSAIIEFCTDQNDAYRVMLHELGHVLGLAHDDLKSSIMHSKLDRRSQYPTAEDVALLKNVYGKKK